MQDFTEPWSTGLRMKPMHIVPILILFAASTPAFANCNSDAAAVETAVASADGYRELQSITDKDGKIKTFVLDFKNKDRMRLSQLDLSGEAGVGVFIGNRFWDRDRSGKFIENTSSSAVGIAQGMIKGKRFRIGSKNSEVRCSIVSGDFGAQLEKFDWTQKEKSFSITYQVWAGIDSHLPVRSTWDYKGRPDIADSMANSLFLFSDAFTIAEPN